MFRLIEYQVTLSVSRNIEDDIMELVDAKASVHAHARHLHTRAPVVADHFHNTFTSSEAIDSH